MVPASGCCSSLLMLAVGAGVGARFEAGAVDSTAAVGSDACADASGIALASAVGVALARAAPVEFADAAGVAFADGAWTAFRLSAPSTNRATISIYFSSSLPFCW